jgi:3-isopropylmalate dehydratase small subunit
MLRVIVPYASLQRWADIFERNSISAGINISMGSRSREETVRAIAETVEEIGPPLREYISSRDRF